MKKTFLLTACLLVSLLITAQNYKLSGRIVDEADKNEGLIGANVMYSETDGTVADIEGNYELLLPAGKYTLRFSYVGYTAVNKEVTLSANTVLDVKLSSSVMMTELMVVADVANSRETPVAFSTLSPKTLQENLASQDIPMALNSTPGVYATQEGGGEGDAQVTIRGFSSRNVGVLLDGVPVNDMENGSVYWSNWFGLDAVTRSMQVQRGLGASKLALPSVGGTINIITKGMDNKRGGRVKQEVGTDGMLRTSVGYNTGALKNGWGFSVAGSYKQGNGWVDETSYSGLFYYLKIDKKLGSHTISLSGYGAPQSHAQRSYKLPIAVYDSVYAEKAGVNLSYTANMSDDERTEVDLNRQRADEGIDRGVKYNQHWGYLRRTADNPNAESEVVNERSNQYHKPQFTLKDSWRINDDIFMSNILYASIGNGGGVRAASGANWLAPDDDGQIDFQKVYDANRASLALNSEGLYGTSSGYLRRLINSHRWFGFLSTVNIEKERFTYSGGIDARYYKGIHYTEVYDMLGADYVKRDAGEYLAGGSDKLYEGGITGYHYDGVVKWGGLFFQTEYKTDKMTAFVNLTGALSSYNRIDYFAGIDEGKSEEETGFNNFPGFTLKAGSKYNFTEDMNAFVNIGYLDKAPRFSNVYDYDNTLFRDIENEKVKAFELGYSYHTSIFTANFNTYYTIWGNRPVDNAGTISILNPETGENEDMSVNINGMDAIHKGLEFDFVINATDELSFQGLVSLGDWRWNSSDSARVYDDNRNLVQTVFFDAKDVHVGNSAQTQLGGELRWEPIKYLYFKPRVTYFTRYYAEFDPMSLSTARDSWMIPSYALVDLHAGYSYKMKGYLLTLRCNVLNVLNTTYIATAQNNDSYNGHEFNEFDAKSASVFMGMGRRFNLSLDVKF